GVPAQVVDGCDMDAVDAAMKAVVSGVRAGGGPAFVETRITRWPGNAGAFPVLHGGDWRLDWAFAPDSAPTELQDWQRLSDPIALYARSLIDAKVVSRQDVEKVDAEIVKAVAEAARFALASPPRKAEAALEHIFA